MHTSGTRKEVTKLDPGAEENSFAFQQHFRVSLNLVPRIKYLKVVSYTAVHGVLAEKMHLPLLILFLLNYER